MMKTSTTFILLGIALVLGIAALFAVPSSIEPEAFSDQGELFFPDLLDPLACKELEIYEPDPETASVKVFKVKFEKGLWRIPSHHGYPADAKDRVASATAALIGIKKDMFRSDRAEDRVPFGVEDPIDDAASIDGRGKKVVMKDESGRTMAEIIVGNQVEDRSDWAYLREPESKRIYAANLRPNKENYSSELIKDVSTDFSDWIDTDVLHLNRSDIEKAVLQNYSVDEERGVIEDQETIKLVKGDGSEWTMDLIGEDEQVKKETLDEMLDTLDDLTIAGVRPTPVPLNRFSLQDKGFFLGEDGNLFGNEGQVEVYSDEGVIYLLFFGEVLFGSGKTVTAGVDEKAGEAAEKDESGVMENRFLFVRVTLDPALEKETEEAKLKAEAEAADKLKDGEEEVKEGEDEKEGAGEEDATEEPSEAEKEKERLEKKLDEARKRVEELNLRFEKWYYVISDESFKKLRKNREDLVELKIPDTSSIGEQPEEKTEPTKKDSGLAYIDIRDGTGDAAAEGDSVKVLYTGWLKDGTEFDRSDNPENPFTLTLGKGEVIKGWDEGIAGMKPGGKRKLIIPPDLGYGPSGSGDKIPPHAVLIFDVERIE